MSIVTECTIVCKNVRIESSGKDIELYITNPEQSDLLDLFEARDAVSHFSEKSLLEEMDEETVRSHFGFPENDGSDEINELNEEITNLQSEIADLKFQIER